MGLFLFIGASILGVNSSLASPMNASESTVQNKSKNDGEIIATLIAVNKQEIAAAGEALKISNNPEVKQYAEMLKKQHTQNLNKTLVLSQKTNIAPVESAKVKLLQKKGAKELKTLSSLKGKNFDKAYIKAMIKGHTEVLHMFDNEFLNNVSNSSLKQLLLKTRPHIKAHLEEAEKIQKSLN
ncbi:DUF4142 domain-containing protein [Legionella sp. PC997]|uniref:DUF4142 domain-containing protein n=1 Tax=Legionella sp. PC997 TaxID=2755562 RepID=UPI0015FE7104|nr:DUF4142 domain-containing protein [Legionella sp. PC997]